MNRPARPTAPQRHAASPPPSMPRRAGGRPPQRPRRPNRPRWRTASLASLSAGIALYVAASLRWEVPWAVGLVYALMSTFCYLAYMGDKAAAQSGQWRTSESRLLWLGLACGWPGGVLAQEVLRHKSAKVQFRRSFWLTVLINLGGFMLAFTPVLEPWTPLYRVG
ncbi:DUF1294 domain-containing protein [Curvibacter sp. RS43]|uniref:DUF1294 domain-containing protein n=1 Tax=Curvibacter microcysteis TaxID=3026419 RepID=UPI002361EF78|nr:DUF1294 domain-containing protein [Curvibacter sp. RS43]MDD0809026.1 DUF1294 domain-containing protein [Curvibacter sp. RS43]